MKNNKKLEKKELMMLYYTQIAKERRIIMENFEKNLKETKKELVEIFENYDSTDRITEDFLYLFKNDGTLDYWYSSYYYSLDETNLKMKQTAGQLRDFYQSEDWTPEDAAYYLLGGIYSIYELI